MKNNHGHRARVGPEKVGRGAVPLTVDLDGTLIKTDLMWECIAALMRRKPWRVFVIPLWWAKGRPYLKAMLARQGSPDLACMPVRNDLLEWLQKEAASGRSLWLVSGSHHWLVKRIAKRFSIFCGVEGTRRKRNLSGGPKAEWLVARFGERGFDYAGDRAVDRHVWRWAREAIAVDASPHVQAMAKNVALRARIWPGSRRWGVWSWGHALRVHQWLKNLLVFTPILTSHRWAEGHLLVAASVAFASFSLIASGLYIFNDLLDLDHDRLHRDKKSRPFADGRLMIRDGLIASPLLVAAGGVLGAGLPAEFQLVLLGYVTVSCAYSLWLKKLILLDAFALTFLYLIRIIGGGVATGIGASNWLVAFALFLFLSLALAKRYAELARLELGGGKKAAGRGYLATHLDAVGWLGMASGLLSVLIVALYSRSHAAALLYRHRPVLLLECAILLLWLARLWVINRKGQLNEDPVRFVAHDGISYVAMMAAFAVILLAR